MSDQPTAPAESVPATSDTPAVDVSPAPVPDKPADSYTLAPTWQQTEDNLRAEIARLQGELDADKAADDAAAVQPAKPVADDDAAVFKAEGPAPDGSAVDPAADTTPAAQVTTVPLPDAGSQATADVAAQQDIAPVSGDVSNAPNDVSELIRDIHRMVTDIHNLVGDLGPTVRQVSQDVSKNGVGGLLSGLLRGGF